MDALQGAEKQQARGRGLALQGERRVGLLKQGGLRLGRAPEWSQGRTLLRQ